MNENIDLKKLEQETFRVANQDGLTEFWMGLMILAMGMLMVNPAFTAYIALIIIFQVAATERIKEKYTYPRIGVVKLHDESEFPQGVGWIAFAIIMIIAVAATFISTRADYEIVLLIANWAPLLVGIVFLQPAVYLVERSGLKRYYGIGVVILVLGALSMLLQFPNPSERMILFLLSTGVVFALAGISSMVRFIRKYPILDSEDVGYDQEE